MGVTAFNRTKKGVTVTRDGEELLSFARMLLEQADIMKEHFADDEKPEGTGYATVVGLYDNYDKTVADKCNETSYGCLYSYEEMEVENNAAD